MYICAFCPPLCRYLDNILSHPGEEKYSKIRKNNKAFSDKVSAVEGAVLFLEAVGFQQKLLPHGGEVLTTGGLCQVLRHTVPQPVHVAVLYTCTVMYHYYWCTFS